VSPREAWHDHYARDLVLALGADPALLAETLTTTRRELRQTSDRGFRADVARRRADSR
jgi:hypothetical protein